MRGKERITLDKINRRILEIKEEVEKSPKFKKGIRQRLEPKSQEERNRRAKALLLKVLKEFEESTGKKIVYKIKPRKLPKSVKPEKPILDEFKCRKWLLKRQKELQRASKHCTLKLIKPMKIVKKPYNFHKDKGKLPKQYVKYCHLTSTLPTQMFLKPLLNKDFVIEFYDKIEDQYKIYFKNLPSGMKRIKMEDVNLPVDGIWHLSQDEKLLRNITFMGFINCYINLSKIRYLCPALHFATNLRTLNLSSNPVGDKGFKLICDTLNILQSLRNLIMNDTNLTHISGENLGITYSNSARILLKIKLSSLHLSRNMINRSKAYTLLVKGFVKQASPLSYLNLSYNGLEGQEIVESLKNLRRLKSLLYLNLRGNLFTGSEILNNLIDLLINHDTLKKLDLTGNPFSDDELKTELKNILDTPPLDDIHFGKKLIINHYYISEKFLEKNPALKERQDIIVKYGGIRPLLFKQLEGMKPLIVKRVNFIYKKSKEKPLKNLVEVLLSQIKPKKLNYVRKDDFRSAFTNINPDLIDKDLCEAVVYEFSKGSKRVNVKEFIDMYNSFFPKKVKKKKKKVKKYSTRKSKDKEEEPSKDEGENTQKNEEGDAKDEIKDA